MDSLNSFGTRRSLAVEGEAYTIHGLSRLQELGYPVARLPFALKVLLENLLRLEDGRSVTRETIEALARWDGKRTEGPQIPFLPARVLLQDFTGVPVVVDLAAMRDAVARMGGDPSRVNPLLPVDLVIDHSVSVDFFGTPEAFGRNIEREFERNGERYAFLRWGQKAFTNFRVVPPGTGICHQVNLEYLSSVVVAHEDGGGRVALPDTLVGTDSHTTMVNGLGVLGWGVGGIEAEAAMLGQPFDLPFPQVVGFKLHGTLPAGSTATDLVLTVTQMLRKKGVVGRLVEYYGPGLSSLSLPDRAVIANMSPEYGATCGLFPIDEVTLSYLRMSGRSARNVALVEAYAREQGMFRTDASPDPVFTDTLELDLGSVVPSVAGPRRPQDRVPLGGLKEHWKEALPALRRPTSKAPEKEHGDVVIAAITSCTNTSNPSVMLGAGLLAKKAVERGLTTKPWVKTSLAPGSKVVTDYLREAGLIAPLAALNFHLVGYGCTTCIGNSGPLPEEQSRAIREKELVAVSVLSGNRNFEGRINPDVRANYLASPPLVVAFALAGRIDIDLYHDPIGKDRSGKDVFLREIWPTPQEIAEVMAGTVHASMFRDAYADVFTGDDRWRALPVPEGSLYRWDPSSTYVQNPPFFDGMARTPRPVPPIAGARVLALLGDSITTDHISPAGSISPSSPAGRYLTERAIEPRDWNSYGSRRGNHEVMMRGRFANVRLRNQMVDVEGGFTLHLPDGEKMSIYDAAMRYASEQVPLLVIGGKEYGSGSSRDWAAKGPALLGVRAVLAESYERIHRSNLIGMGILPLQFLEGQSAASLGLTGRERYTIHGIDTLTAGSTIEVTVEADGAPGATATGATPGAASGARSFQARARIDSPIELEYYKNGGILPYVLRHMM
ncbi:MAG: aconitate hydratase AcnA [Candidatus Eisenbacteria bacterium]|nr:aconitate hydratase AcnA [Candidatus Eisenbacteria bacterium]